MARLTVGIHARDIYDEDVNKLAELIRGSALLRLAEADEVADVWIKKGDSQLKIVDRPAWVVVDQDGKLIMPIYAMDEANVTSILCDNLEKLVRYRQAIVLGNPDEESLLKGKVDFVLKRQKTDGSWEVAEPDNGQIVFEEGERISCEIINRYDSPIHISVFDFGLTCAVELLYPIAGVSERLEPGRSVQIGVHEDDIITLCIPENFPYFPDNSMPIGGIETLKLFATIDEADFSYLIQPGFRNTSTRTIHDGVSTGVPRRNHIVVPAGEWTTIECSFFLQHKLPVSVRSLREASKISEFTIEEHTARTEKLRFIQAQVLQHSELRQVDGVFPEGVQYDARVRIGPADQSWLMPQTSFPEHLLPSKERHVLQVFFSEPNRSPDIQTETIVLPRYGHSTDCHFFFRVKKETPIFEGRIIVAYKNRILQTALLKGEVMDSAKGHSFRLEVEAVIRPTMAGLSARPEFDLALLVNHDSNNRPRLTKLADDGASIRDIEDIQVSIRNIQERLENAARTIADGDIGGSLRSPDTEALLNFLAYHGRILYEAIITDQVDVGWVPRHPERVQLVSAHAEAFLPIEFLYEKPIPAPDAKLCPRAEQALKEGRCQNCLIQNDSGPTQYICPTGFWCLSRVIERHAHDVSYSMIVNSSDYVMQSEPVDNRNVLHVLRTCLFAASDRVDSVLPGQRQQLLNTLNSVSNNAMMVSKWNDWAKEVAMKHPTFLILMPHTIEDEVLRAPAMEIGTSDRLIAGYIKPNYINTSPDYQAPIVALLGCETMVPYNKYMGFVPQFRRNGAALVLCTLTTVLGRHVVPIAQKLVEELKAELEEGDSRLVSFGDILLQVRRKILLQGLPIVLCLVAFGDADWRLER